MITYKIRLKTIEGFRKYVNNMVEKISTTTFQEPIYSQNIQQFLYNHLSLKETIGCAASEHTSAFCSLLLPLRAMKPLYSVLMSDPIDY